MFSDYPVRLFVSGILLIVQAVVVYFSIGRHPDFYSYLEYFGSEYFWLGEFTSIYNGPFWVAVYLATSVVCLNLIANNNLSVLLSLMLVPSSVISLGFLNSTVFSLIFLFLYLKCYKVRFFFLVHPITIINAILYEFNVLLALCCIVIVSLVAMYFDSVWQYVSQFDIVNMYVSSDYSFLIDNDTFFKGSVSNSIYLVLALSMLVLALHCFRMVRISPFELRSILLYVFFAVPYVFNGGAFFGRLIALPILVASVVTIDVILRLFIGSVLRPYLFGGKLGRGNA